MIVKTTQYPTYSIEGLTRTQMGWLIVCLRRNTTDITPEQAIALEGRSFARNLLTQCEQEVKL